MRSLVAAFLLLVPLQPALGAVACLAGFRQPKQAECEMPANQGSSSEDLSSSMPTPAQSCPLASVCAAAPLAILSLPQVLETNTAIPDGLPLNGPAQAPEVYTAPPFHPPKV